MKKLTIPEIREEMQLLSAEQAVLSRRLLAIAKRIDALAAETHRRTYTRAPVTSRRITPAVRASVRRMATVKPDLSQQALAEAHDINIGRVSEILHGKRG